LSGLARKPEVLVGGFVEGVQPEGLFPGEYGVPSVALLPLGIAQGLERAGGGFERHGLAKCFGCLRVVRRAVGGDAGLEEGVGRGTDRSQAEKRGEQKTEGQTKSKV
jgi:hypothetical protein